MWQVIFTKRARKDLLSLEKIAAKRIMAKLEKAGENHKHYFSSIVDSDYHKLRVGDYHIIAVLDIPKKTISIRRVGHRRNIYKQL